VIVPKPGGRVDVLDLPELKDWWSAVGSQSDHDAVRSATAR
jgi:hypothetical protein